MNKGYRITVHLPASVITFNQVDATSVGFAENAPCFLIRDAIMRAIRDTGEFNFNSSNAAGVISKGYLAIIVEKEN